MKIPSICTTLICCSVLTAVTTASIANEEVDNSAIELRRSHLKSMSDEMKLLGGMAKTKVPFDQTKASAAASKVEEIAAMLSSAELWPEGSDLNSNDHDGNRAQPNIWEDLEAFLSGFSDLSAHASELVVATDGGLEAMQQVLGGPMGKTCKGCHTDFRAKPQ